MCERGAQEERERMLAGESLGFQSGVSVFLTKGKRKQNKKAQSLP